MPLHHGVSFCQTVVNPVMSHGYHEGVNGPPARSLMTKLFDELLSKSMSTTMMGCQIIKIGTRILFVPAATATMV